jgi:hypothetical protein
MDNYNSNISANLQLCTEDITTLATITLEAQVRAYDLLDAILADESGSFRNEAGFIPAAKEFLQASEARTPLYDEEKLRQELSAALAPLDENINEARFKAASIASLHEFAKETFEIWKTSGIFARRRALKELRQRAGFRLEAHRIGNYVAKTFDLMNEANSQFAKAQQARFSADVSYKIRPDLYESIAKAIKPL